MDYHNIDQIYHASHKKLINVNRNFFLLKAIYSLLELVVYCSAVLIGFVVLEIMFTLPLALRVGFWVVVGGIILFIMVRELFPNLRRAFSPKEEDLYVISRKIGRNDLDVQDALINFLQIYRDQGIRARPAFKNLSLGQLYQKFRNTNFYSVISFRLLRKPANRLLISALTVLLLFLIFPVSMNQAVLKVLYPRKSFEKPLPISVKNLSGDLTVLKNEAAQLKGEYNGLSPQKLWLVVKTHHGSTDSSSVERTEIPVTGKTFTYQINHVKNNFNYWFTAQLELAEFTNRPALSDTATVTVKERPFVRDLQVKLTYPQYTGLKPSLLPSNNGEVTALLGTEIDVEIEANKRLNRAYLMFADSTTTSLNVTENRARGEFVVEKDDQYQIMIVDNDSIPNYQPVKYSIFALSDEHPYVEITQPGEDIDLGDNLELPLLINLRDDYGFVKLHLKGKHIHAGSSGDTTEISLPLKFERIDQNRAIADFSWDLSSLYLIPDDFVEYYAIVYDNDIISGPKSARSKTYIIRLPSLIDMFEETDKNIAEQMKNTEDVARETEELKKKLEDINREMKREKELAWERKKEIQEQVDKQKKSLEKLDQVQKNLEEMIDQLDTQKMLSAETLEKYFELQKMFKDLATPELMESMKKVQEALEKSDMNELKKAMENFQFSVESFERQVERTHELFKRIELEQKMDELVKMAEKMTEDQKQINKKLKEDKLSDSEKSQLANKEDNIEKDTEFFDESLKEAKENFKETLGELAKELEKTEEFMQKQQLSSKMQQMEQQIRQGETQNARKSGENLERQLEMLQSMMQKSQQNMMQQQKQEVMQAMQKVQQDMLRASFKQEQLHDQANQADVASSRLSDITRKQAQLRENANHLIKQLIDISQKTFLLSPQMNQIMSALMQNMGKSLNSLEDRKPQNAARAQRQAMSNFNQAIIAMQGSMNQLSQSQSASGLQQFMQQLQQMAGQQGQLNQQTMSLFQQQQKGEGRPSLSKDALARMAAQQDMIRRSLQHLTEGTGERRDVLGRLSEVGEEMEQVVDELKKQKLDSELVERQQRILSRLLDAQKSIREKEYSRKRQAERENLVVKKSPPELKKELLQRENRLRKEMLESLKEGYSSEYQEFIKSYYEILSRQPGEQP